MPFREFTDGEGVVWTVWSTFPRSGANVRPHFAQGWLSFQSSAQRRRLAPVPPDWEAGDDDQLRALLLRAHDSRSGGAHDAGAAPAPADLAHVSETGPRRGIQGGLERIRQILRTIGVGDEKA